MNLQRTWFTCIWLGIVLIASTGLAQTLFVSDELKLTLRSGPGTEFRILDVLETGQVLTIQDRKEPWVKVRTEDGEEGWVLERYLSAEKPKGMLLDELQSRYNSLSERAATLSEQNAELKTQNQTLQKELESKSLEFDQLREAHETLKNESQSYLTLKAEYEALAERLADQTRKAEAAGEKVERLQNRYAIWWFVSGAGVLLVGFIIGLSSRRRRRSSILR